MASADSLRFSPPSLTGLSYTATYRKASPGMHGLFPPINLRIYLPDFVRISDFPVLSQVIRPERPQMRFLYVGSGFCLGPLSATTLTGATLPLTNGSLPKGP